MLNKVRIAIDAMGGIDSPKKILPIAIPYNPPTSS